MSAGIAMNAVSCVMKICRKMECHSPFPMRRLIIGQSIGSAISIGGRCPDKYNCEIGKAV